MKTLFFLAGVLAFTLPVIVAAQTTATGPTAAFAPTTTLTSTTGTMAGGSNATSDRPRATADPIRNPHPDPWKVVISFVILALVLGGILRLGASTNLLRDPAVGGASGLPPFSLGRCQMAIWTVAVLWAFLYVWQYTGDTPKISPSVLGLIGIAAGTSLSAAVVGANSRSQNIQKLTDLQAKLAEQTLAIGGSPLQLTELRNEIERVTKQLAPQRTEGFFTDILSDGDGVSFHRFQMVAWTVALVVVFVFGVIDQLEMREFDKTLLALMGISSGTYVGFKISE